MELAAKATESGRGRTAEVLDRRPLVGQRLPRIEDRRLITGAARYVDDLRLDGMLHLRLVRSPSAHGRVISIQTATEVPGALVLTAADLGDADRLRARYQPSDRPMPDWPLLASDRVRYVGDPVAAVLAGTPYEAEDAAEEVYADIEDLEPIVDPTQVPAGALPLHESFPDNVLFRAEIASGEEPTGPDIRTIRRRFRTRRHTGVPMETRGCLARVEGDQLMIWASTQMPHLLRTAVADTLGWSEDRVRVRVPDIGGGFGVKGHVYADEVLVAVLAVKTGRPVKWIEDRNENLVASIHARDHRYEVELDVDRDGHILSLRADITIDCGAYPVWPQTAALEAQMAATVLPGPYRIPHYHCVSRAVATNKAPHGTYRGVARPSSTFSLERLIDEAARELGIDPIDMRLRNVVTEFPHLSPTGLEYDAGSYEEAIVAARDAVALERSRTAPRREGMLTGVGFACFIEQAAHVPPWARPTSNVVKMQDRVEVVVDADGQVTVDAGVSTHGQGHETTLAQVVADRLGLPLTSVRIRYGDTDRSPYSMGTLASRSAVVAGNTAAAAAERLAERLKQLASAELGVGVDVMDVAGGEVSGGGRSVRIGDLAASQGEAGELGADAIYDGPSAGTFSNACHAAVVDIDVGTGQVYVRRYVVVEDCGTMVNPLVVDGQLHGGVAQGIGSALYEELVYDDDGQLITGTFMDYRLPSTLEVPDIEIRHQSTPAANPLGVKGMGESGAIGPMAAIANAVADALGPDRAGHVVEVPLVPWRVWAILNTEVVS